MAGVEMRLRQQVMRGGAYLSVRQALGMVVGLVGIVLLTRSLGPAEYGLYAAAFGVLLYLQQLSAWGVDTYLIRREGEERVEVYHLAHTFLLAAGSGAAMVALAAIPLLEAWVAVEGLGGIFAALFVSLPVAVLARVPIAKLERALDFRAVALVELAGQLVFYVVAVVLALRGWQAWAPVVGWWAQQVLTVALVYPLAAYRPRLRWDPTMLREMVGYGLSYSASMWVHQLRWLVNPLVVGRFLGAPAVAYVDLAIRLVRVLGFVGPVAWRLSLASFVRLREDRGRLLGAMTHGMQLQLLAVGPLLVMMAWVAPVVVPRVFGQEWTPVVAVYPFVALGTLCASVFNLHSSVLYVFRHNWSMARFHFVHVALFAAAAWLLVPRVGVVGYGAAELVALAGYPVIHGLLVRHVGKPRYGLAAAWTVAFGLALFVHQLGWPALGGLIAVVVWPASWLTVRGYAREIMGLRHAV